MPPLAETQRRFFGALRFPLRGASRRSTELPACGDPHTAAFLATADELLRPSPTLLPAECLELYHRQYWFRLLDSIAEDFPGLRRLLGDGPFWKLIEDYLTAHPSGSFTLRHLGRSMPAFIESCSLDAGLRRRAIAVAAIEWAMMECFEAASTPIPSPDELATHPIILQAHVRLLGMDADASTWLNNPDAAWADASRNPQHAAVWRSPVGGARHRRLDAGEYLMLSLIQTQSRPMHAWIEAGSHHIPDPGTLSRWFAAWQSEGWLAAV